MILLNIAKKCITSGVFAVCSTMREVKQAIDSFADGADLFKIKNNFR
jgi:hypothetical protein